MLHFFIPLIPVSPVVSQSLLYADLKSDLIGNRLISQHAKLRAVFQPGVRQYLDHKDADQFFLRINPETDPARGSGRHGDSMFDVLADVIQQRRARQRLDDRRSGPQIQLQI